ncbi:hypothetical protein CR513_45589, partial [Mucuna pruriens]
MSCTKIDTTGILNTRQKREKHYSRTKGTSPIKVKTPELQSLRRFGIVLKGSWRRSFERKHGKILDLMEIKLAPTLEEYKLIMGQLLTEYPPYLYQGHYPFYNMVANLLKVPKPKFGTKKSWLLNKLQILVEAPSPTCQISVSNIPSNEDLEELKEALLKSKQEKRGLKRRLEEAYWEQKFALEEADQKGKSSK